MGSVGSSTAANSALNDNVVDNASINVKFAGLSVCLKVDEEFTDSLERLLGPSSLGVLVDLALSVTSNTTGVPSEGNNLFVLKTVVHVVNGSVQLHALASTSDFVCVLIMSSQVGDSALSSYEKKDSD